MCVQVNHVKQGTMRLAYSPRFFFSTNYEWVYEPNPSPDRKYQNLEVNLVPISYILVSTQNSSFYYIFQNLSGIQSIYEKK